MTMAGRGEKIGWTGSGKIPVDYSVLPASKQNQNYSLFDSFPMHKCYFDNFSHVMSLHFTKPFFSWKVNFKMADTS